MSNSEQPSSLVGKRFFPFIAPPSGGKGTQTHALLQTFGDRLSSVDMGGMLRQVVERGDHPYSQLIRDTLKQGKLVELDIVMTVFTDGLKRIASEHPGLVGFILDGFPRSMEQLGKLRDLCEREGCEISRAFYLNVPDDVILGRVAGRVFCNQCKRPFSLNVPSLQLKDCGEPGCKIEQNDYFQREDDQEATVRRRLASFHADTRPIVDWCREAGCLQEFDGNRSPESVTEELTRTMTALLATVPAGGY